LGGRSYGRGTSCSGSSGPATRLAHTWLPHPTFPPSPAGSSGRAPFSGLVDGFAFFVAGISAALGAAGTVSTVPLPSHLHVDSRAPPPPALPPPPPWRDHSADSLHPIWTPAGYSWQPSCAQFKFTAMDTFLHGPGGLPSIMDILSCGSLPPFCCLLPNATHELLARTTPPQLTHPTRRLWTAAYIPWW